LPVELPATDGWAAAGSQPAAVAGMETITARHFPTPCTKHSVPRGVSPGTADRAALVSAGLLRWRPSSSIPLDQQVPQVKRRRQAMTSRTFVNLLSIAARQRLVASAIIYGLSLAVRFTSATGEEVEIPAQSLQRTSPLMSIRIEDGLRLPFQGWGPNAAQ